MHVTAIEEPGLPCSSFLPYIFKLDEAMLKDLLVLFSMKINDENQYIIFCNRKFSDLLEVIAAKTFFCVQTPRLPFPTMSTSKGQFLYRTHDTFGKYLCKCKSSLPPT